jgi:bla regulator protein blaR1
MKILTAFVLLAIPLSAQSTPERLEFEVASLKPSPANSQGYSILPIPGGRLQARNIALKRLIAVAYSVTDFQIYGNLNWLESQHYDMDAKAPGPAALPQLRLMLRSLLEERFHLKIHREAKELPIFSLTPAKAGEPGGPGLTPTPEGDCSASATDQAPLANGTPCGVVNLGRGRINGQRGRISQLADRLSTLLDRTVVDKTGLTGNFNIAVTWTPDPDLERNGPGGQPPPDPASGPSLFTALQQQLGLKLTPGKGPVEVIVVDSAEKVTGN